MIKRLLFTCLLCAISFTVGIKTNALYWGTVTPNLGLEFRLARHWSLDLEAGLNPFTGKNDDGSYGKSIKHLRVHPELRYWFCETYHGHFLGLHVPYLIYNVSDIKWLGTENERHQGWGTGAGISYGYSWVLGKHWNIEATLGVGYLLCQLWNQDGNRQETLCRPYAGSCQCDLFILKTCKV